MNQSYYILIKKSIFGLAAAFFVFAVAPVSAATPNDPGYPYQQSNWTQIHAPEAWELTTGSSKVVVAIVDIGVNYNHPDIQDNIWTNSDEIAGNGVDDDGNGYIDDVRGWNFVENNNDPNVPAKGGGFGDEDTLSHGTAIAGLIGAAGNNKIWGAGLNWKVQIMPIRAIDNYGSGNYRSITKAINYAVDNGADVINISFVGDNADENLRAALKRAYERGILVTVAAGNDRESGDGDLDAKPFYPICLDRGDNENWLIGVTSVDSSDVLSEFADYGSCVDLSAPGEKVYSIEREVASDGTAGFRGPWRGTSFAAPLVAGTAALVKSIRPEWTASDIIPVLLSSADDIDANNSTLAGRVGYGRLNVYAAIKRASNEKHDAGDLDNICYAKNSKLFCYEASTGKNIYLTDIGSAVIDYDWVGGKYTAALSRADGEAQIQIFVNNGVLYRSWRSDFLFDKIKFIYMNGEWRAVVSGYDAKSASTRVVIYDLYGTQKYSFSVNGSFGDFALDSSNNFWAAAISAGKIKLFEYDLSGKKLNELDGPAAASISQLIVKKVWSGFSEQAVAAVNGAPQSSIIIMDLDSGSYSQNSYSNSGDYLLVAGDYDKDGLYDVFKYQFSGGNYSIITGKGSVLKTVALPKLL